jgi:hypothetical protein
MVLTHQSEVGSPGFWERKYARGEDRWELGVPPPPLARLLKLRAKVAPVILLVEPETVYDILALNTEKAHTLKEKSLEVDVGP